MNTNFITGKSILRTLALSLLLYSILGVANNAKVPDFTLSGPDGTVQLYEQLKHGPAIVVMWATNCPFCHALLPHLQSLSYEKGMPPVFAISTFEEDGADPAGFFESHGYRMQLLVEGDQTFEAFGGKGFPAVYLVDSEGRIQFDLDQHRLPPNFNREEFAAMSDEQQAALMAPRWAARLREAISP